MAWDFLNARDALASPDGTPCREWDTLNDTLFNSHPLLCHAFVGPLVRHFGARDLQLARLGDARAPQALLLVQQHCAGLWQTFLPGQAQISPMLPGKEFDPLALLRALPGLATGIAFLCQDPLYSFAAGGSSATHGEEQRHCTTTAVSLDTSFEQYWNQRPKNLRKNMKRYFSRAEDDGHAPALRLVSDPHDLPAALERYGILESAGWKGKAGTAIHPGNQQGLFYADVMSGFAAFDGARIYELYLGDHLAASRLCIARGGMLVVLKTTYDESLSQLAPGRLLLYSLLEMEFTNGKFATVEFYTNASHDSISWATATRDISHRTWYRYPAIRSLIVGSRRVRQAFSRPGPPPPTPRPSSSPSAEGPPGSPH